MGQVVEHRLHELLEGDGVADAEAVGEPLGEGIECTVGGGGLVPDEGGRVAEIAAVHHQVPVSGEPAHTLKFLKGEVECPEDFVRRERGIDHPPFGIVANNGRAAQPFEDADLDFLWVQGMQTIESGCEGLEILTGEPGDEVGMNMDTGVLAEESEVILQSFEVLTSADAFGCGRVKSLDSDLELESARGELLDQVTELGGQAVRNHFEVEEESGPQAFEEELEDCLAGGQVQVEGAINEFELIGAAVEESLHRGQERFEREGPDRNIDGGEAEFAGKGATPGGLDIKQAVLEIGIGVMLVGRLDLGQVGQGGTDDLWKGIGGVSRGGEEPPADVGEFEVGFTGDDVGCECGEWVGFGVMADLGSAENDADLRVQASEELEDLGGLLDVPDIDAESDDAGLVLEQTRHDIQWALLKIKFEEDGSGLELPEIGVEVSKPEGGVDELGVEGGENEIGHGTLEWCQ